MLLGLHLGMQPSGHIMTRFHKICRARQRSSSLSMRNFWHVPVLAALILSTIFCAYIACVHSDEVTLADCTSFGCFRMSANFSQASGAIVASTMVGSGTAFGIARRCNDWHDVMCVVFAFLHFTYLLWLCSLNPGLRKLFLRRSYRDCKVSPRCASSMCLRMAR